MSKVLLLFILIAVEISIISPFTISAAPPVIQVFVSIAPQKFFVEKIGKDLVDVKVMVQTGASPAVYEPKPAQMVALSTAELYFSIGVPFEVAWLKKIAATNPKIKIIQTDRNVKKMAMETHHQNCEDKPYEGKQYRDTGSHCDKTELHGNIGTDPHIWLSPTLVLTQARSILNALQEIDPERRTAYYRNYKAFVSEVVNLDLDLMNMFADKVGSRFMVFHPTWGYFAATYGLKQVPIEIEGKEPKSARLMKLIEQALEYDVRVIFVQPQFSTRNARLVAKAIQGEVVFVDPLAENWIMNLRAVGSTFQQAVK